MQADPKLAWMKQAEARGDIDWRQVKEIHDSFKYESSGLGAGAKIAIAILMSFILGPAGLGLSGSNLAVAASLSTTAVTSTIDNKGNLGLAVKDTFSTGSLKNAAIAGFTAGLLDHADDKWFTAADGAGSATQGIQPTDGAAVGAANSSKDIFRWSNASDAATRTVGRALISSGVSSAIGGGSFGSNFSAALMGEAGQMAMASGFNWIGDNAIHFPDASVQKVVAHAIMGGLLAELTGSDFKTGAAAAGLNEVMVSSMGDLGRDNKELRLVLSQLTGLVAAAAVDGDLDKGVAIAKGATQYNHDLHEPAAKQMAQQALDQCRENPLLCDMGIDFSKLTVDDIVFAMRVEGEHGKGIENAKPEAIAFVDGFMFSRAPHIVGDLYTETESERYRLGVEAKASLVLAVINLGNGIRSFGNYLQGLVRATPTGVPVAKAVDELAAKGTGGAGQAAKNPNSTSAMTDAEAGMPYSHPVKPAAKETAKNLVSGETKVVGIDKPAANDANFTLALPSGKKGSVVRGALEEHEFKQASDIVSFRGGQFKGADTPSFAGIDGWLDGVPVQLKTIKGTSINSVRRNILSGAEDMAKAGYKGDLYIDAASTGVSMEKMLSHFKSGSPVSNVVGEGAVSNIYIKTQDGWMNISSGRVSQYKGWE
ncbi:MULTISPECIES: DUF637 domain-containing protein [Pseudomonas]|uniref:DUF637 domain-containing protein n=1 Tax=Pseudomonas TaxID=286 RepID=UPI001F3159B6|nr:MULTISPECIES: DUF637 domain-containing protein [Pseudomonas]ULT68718.1 DUF637 domain-containing protein [Pseudomonas sp. BC42]